MNKIERLIKMKEQYKEPYITLLESEEIKKNKTRAEIPGFYNFIPHVYNTLLKLHTLTGELAKDEDRNLIKIQDVFQLFIYDVPFKIKNIFNLMEIGGYADAVILYRSFVESFIVYKYFILTNNGEGLSKYVLEEHKMRIKDIFEKTIPGYYESLYSEMCKFIHGNPLVTAIFHGNVTENIPLKTNIFNINLKWFSYISNQLMPLIIGVIEMYKVVFPNNTIEENYKVKNEIDLIYNFIKNDINDRETSFPQQKKMIDYYNKIIDMTTKIN